MNIVIVGPGNDPKRFGTNFVNKAEADGHTVTKFSYRLETSSPEEIEVMFENTLSDLDNIDLFVYNTIGGFYPGNVEDYTSEHAVNYEQWQKGILINAALPHMMTLKCLQKMNESSKTVFLTSSASYLINRDNYLQMAGYFGTKGAMNQLMRSLAEYNDKNSIVCTLAPHIPYDDPSMAEIIMKKLYDTIMSLSRVDTGKIIQCYPPGESTFYHEGGKKP